MRKFLAQIKNVVKFTLGNAWLKDHDQLIDPLSETDYVFLHLDDLDHFEKKTRVYNNNQMIMFYQLCNGFQK